MLKFLCHKLDFFKTPFFLRTKNYEKTSTQIGFIFSLGVIIFLSIFFFGSDVFHHKRPSTSDQSIQLLKRENIDLNKENFGLVWGLTDFNGVVYNDNSIYSLSLIQAQKETATGSFLEFSQKESHLCNSSDFKIDDSFSRYGYNCLNNNSLNLNGGFDESYSSFFGFMISICNNITSNNTCKDPKVISDFFQDKYFTIYFKETNYNLNDYKNPTSSIYKNYFWSISSKMRKIIHISLKKLEIKTDDGFFFQNENILEGYKQDTVDLDIDLNVQTELLTIFFASSSKKQYATRNYQKIQEVIAGIGGIFSFLSSLGFILTYYHNYLNRINDVMNQLYSFPNINKAKKRKLSLVKSLKNHHVKASFLKKKNKIAINDNALENQLNVSITHSDNDYTDSIDQKFKENFLRNKSQNLIEIKAHNSEPIIGGNKKFKSTNLSAFSLIKKKTKNCSKIKNLHREISKSNNKYKFSTCNFFMLIIKRIFKCELNNDENLFLKTEKKFLNEIDLVSILMKLHEIDKIKLLLFNERQLSLINLLSKPMNYVKNQKDSSTNIELDMNQPSVLMSVMLQKNLKSDKIFEYYQETLKLVKDSEIDRKLIRFLDEKANELITK